MIIVKIKDNHLMIEDLSRELFEWNHRTFFNISLGLECNEEQSFYVYKNKDDYYFLINEIITYLEEEKIEYTTDQEVQKYIVNIKNHTIEFNNVKNNDIKITDALFSLKRSLKDYQKKSVEHLLRVMNGANFSVPGSGKTTVVYAYFDILKKSNIVEKLFVIGPYSCFSPWEDESILCFGEKLNSARLSTLQRHSCYFQAEKYDLFLCHYQTMSNDVDDIIALCNKYKILMVVDESHNIKRFDGGVWANAILKISPYATRRVILSGTPMPNGYADLWTQLTFLWPGKQLLGERNAYKNRLQDGSQHEEIKKEIRPFFSRVKKSDLDLPKPVWHKTYYSLNPVQKQIYHALSIKLLSDLNLQPNDNQKLRFWRRAKMIRLLQAATNPTLLSLYSEEFDIPPLHSDGVSIIKLIEQYSKYETPSKIVALIDLIRKLISDDRKVIVWTSFIHNIKMLEVVLQDIKHFSIYGAIPRDDTEDEIYNREKIIQQFKTIRNACVLIANPAACAESISLHRVCHDAIYLDRTFNCGQFIQSLDRIHRIGLDKTDVVNYHILIAKDTIDETIDRRLEEKQKLMLSVLEDELPVGSFEIGDFEKDRYDNEENCDFEETVNDIKKTFKDNKQPDNGII